MVTYQYLYAFIVINFVIQGIVLLLGSMSKKISRFKDILMALCWFVFSLFYVLRISRNLPADLHYNHIFLELFLTIVYGFGFWIFVILTFILASVSVTQILSPEASSSKKIPQNSPNHSPLPLWVINLAIGLFSAYMLKESMIPLLNNLMNAVSRLVYIRIFHSSVDFPECYLLPAGLAAGTVVTGCFTHAYRRSRVPFMYFTSMILVPVLTAVLAPLVDLSGSLLVVVLVQAAIMMKSTYALNSKRNPAIYFLLALGIGTLSGFYFSANGVTVYKDSELLTIVGGVVSGLTIACLGFKSYSTEDSAFRSLYFLPFIPFCTPGFSSAIAYVICLASSLVFGFCLSAAKGRGDVTELYYNGSMVINHGDGRMTINERGEYIDIEYTGFANRYKSFDGRIYERTGMTLSRIW